MAQVTIDSVTYDTDTLSAAAKAQLANIQATDMEIQHLQNLLSIAATARASYGAALKAELPAPPKPHSNPSPSGAMIKTDRVGQRPFRLH